MTSTLAFRHPHHHPHTTVTATLTITPTPPLPSPSTGQPDSLHPHPQNPIRVPTAPPPQGILNPTSTQPPTLTGSHRMPGGPPTLGFSLIIYATVGLTALIALKLRGRRK
ncbi:hypothetical protein GCM10022224_014390 [Nonomuraea antimicrobica]|uniref:Gram-positive cocci surface proteins LPxTG domain-containing protein n=1 Tax=Nonomuraea antimicrobica TaxID=561173 RepID=A0ABP7B894_9ACTN